MSVSLQLRSIHLRVANLARSLEFYSRQIGFSIATQNDSHAELTTPTPAGQSPALLQLTEDRSAPPVSSQAAGLFHAALLLPSRPALARWLRHARDAGVAFAGFSDHGVSEAIYLADPDGNGLEIYCDRPPSAWPRVGGELAMVTLPLDLPSLLAEADPPERPLLGGAVWGHFHFRVTNLERSEKFYSDALGVTLTQRYGTSARFLSADGYHHHVGLNTWGQPRLPHSDAALGLVETAFVRAGTRTGKTLRDPDGISVRITSD
jgi:catechol 2,3-dioxygenase